MSTTPEEREVWQQAADDLTWDPLATWPYPNREWRRQHMSRVAVNDGLDRAWAKALYAITNDRITFDEADKLIKLHTYVHHAARNRVTRIMEATVRTPPLHSPT